MSEADNTQVHVDNVENVTATVSPLSAHPAVIYLVAAVTIGVLLGFGWVSFFILSSDTGVTSETKGAVIQTWNNLAVAAAAVWTTSRVVDRVQGKQ